MAAGDVKITDGSNTVFFNPAARLTVDRSVDFTKGYFLMPIVGQANPEANDQLMTNQVIRVAGTFVNRKSDYVKLFDTMFLGRAQGTEFTFSIETSAGTESWTVTPGKCVMQIVGGEKEMRYISVELVVVADGGVY